MDGKRTESMEAGSGGAAASKLLMTLAIAGAMGVAGLGGYALSNFLSHDAPPPPAADAPAEKSWAASAPGRVEAKSGDVRIGSAVLGRIAEIHVSMNDRVEVGEVLVRLEDDEARAKLAAAEAEAGARERERNAQPTTSGREDVRKAEDAVYRAERAVTGARYALDAALLAKRRDGGNDRRVANARKRLADAQEDLQRERIALASAQSRSDLPAPSRLEAALTAARAEVSLAQLQFDRTRIRAPMDGTVLEVLGKVGETVAPSPGQAIVLMSDPNEVVVKAEVDERDIPKLKVGQRAFVRSAAFPGREIEGRITALAPMLASPRLNPRGPRRPTDVEVLEVTVEFEKPGPLIPGLRVDTFFRRES